MTSHNSSDWLYVFRKDADWLLAGGDCLEKIITSLNDPHTQYPSTVLLVGGQEREAAQRAMFSCFDFIKPRGLAQLYVDASTLDDDYPLLVASLDIETAYHSFKPPRKTFGGVGHKLEWLSPAIATESLVDTVISRVLLLFTDVICIFLDDFPTPGEGIHLIQRWTEAVQSIRPWKPQVILITSCGPMNIDILNTITFGEARHVRLRPRNSNHSQFHRHRGLKRIILQNIETVQKRKVVCKRLFSAKHVNVLFKLALQHAAKCILPNFDFILATRRLNEVDDHFTHHLKIFLELCAAKNTSRDVILQYIASAVILDSLPPGMHHFNPQETFHTLYYQHCYKAFSSQFGDDLLPTDWSREVEATYCHFYSELEDRRLTASELHLQNLQSLQINWSTFRSSRLCLFCLDREPEHPLQCGHSCCDICACIFGNIRPGMEYSYQITRCILCQSNGELEVRIKPPTAGSRLLVLDGGGIRGAFTLQILQALDKHRKLPYPIYDEFDLALGTSTGGLIVLMFLLRREVSDCITAFKGLAGKAFSCQNPFGSSIFARLLGFVSSLLTDSLYGATKMEECVKEAYGPDTLLFGSLGSVSRVSGIKVAVTTMAVSNSRLCILSNYNGRQTRKGYKHYRPLRVEDEVLVRDAARATSAAPSYFPAKFIRGLGFLQEGGAGKHNNPIDPAEWESRAIWDVVPDVALSIGTGYARDPDSPPIISQRLPFRDRFFARLARLFNAVLSAQGSWDDHMNRTKPSDKHKYFRINIALEKEPPLDDVGEIPEMENSARTFLKGYDLSGITQALFAASFFFELHQKPAMGRQSCICHGTIRCRSPDTRALIKRISEEYPAASFTTEDGTNLGFINNCTLCAICGLYCHAVTFKVCHFNQNMSIFLKFNRLSQHRISGFPDAMSQFSRRQLLGAEFGRPDHHVGDYTGCRCTVSRKRKRAAATTVRSNKRQCISFVVHSV